LAAGLGALDPVFAVMKYRLTEKIGSGGMAEVFRAVAEGPEGFERSFVVKRIHPRLSEAPEFVRMFVDEAKISARLVHPNIVQVFEFAHQAGGYYIVMEPVDGVDMGRLMRRLEQRREVPPPVFVAEIGRQACRGLEFAHTLSSPDGQSLGIVHRDVTPPNIMVAWNGTVKILDFGIARAVRELRTNLTEAGMVKGKMAYVAPELLQGKTADARSDVFSLGVVMHGLLCGRQLFQGENDLETLKQVQEMTIPPPSARNPGVKRALDAIVMRALARDPDRRYGSAAEMGDELETLVLRERYSARALARKARELVPPDDVVAPPDAGALPGSADGSLGEREAMVVVDEVPNRSERSLPTVSPPPPVRATAAPRRAADRTRRSWLATGVPWLLAAGLGGVVAARSLDGSLDPRGPAPGAAAQGTAAAAAPIPATVRVSLDSTPQGAIVTASGGPVAGVPDGARLGETPLLLTLPRAEAAVQVQLGKPGFSPLTYKLIPHQDRDVVVHLEPAVAPAPAVAMARERVHVSSRRASGALVAKTRLSTAATGATAATTATTATTAALAGRPAAPAPRPLLPIAATASARSAPAARPGAAVAPVAARR